MRAMLRLKPQVRRWSGHWKDEDGAFIRSRFILEVEAGCEAAEVNRQLYAVQTGEEVVLLSRKKGP